MADFHRKVNELLDALKERSQYPVCRSYFGLKEIESRRVNADDISSEEVRSVREELREKGHELEKETGKHCYIEAFRESDGIYVVRLSLKTPQKELEAEGIDAIGWNLTYSKIAGKICPEGEADNIDAVAAAEVRLEQAVRARVYDKSIPYHNQFDRDHIRRYASENGMDPDAVEEVFDFLTAKNEHVQSLRNPIKEEKEKEEGYGGGWKQHK